jgi:hypothetical protein
LLPSLSFTSHQGFTPRRQLAFARGPFLAYASIRWITPPNRGDSPDRLGPVLSPWAASALLDAVQVVKRNPATDPKATSRNRTWIAAYRHGAGPSLWGVGGVFPVRRAWRKSKASPRSTADPSGLASSLLRCVRRAGKCPGWESNPASRSRRQRGTHPENPYDGGTRFVFAHRGDQTARGRGFVLLIIKAGSTRRVQQRHDARSPSAGQRKKQAAPNVRKGAAKCAGNGSATTKSFDCHCSDPISCRRSHSPFVNLPFLSECVNRNS